MNATTLLGVLLMDAGLLALAVGAGSLIRPPRRLGITTRRRAALVVGGGAVLACVAAALPAPLRTARSPRASLPASGAAGPPAPRIDDFAPAWQFQERHEVLVHAAPARVLWAVKTVTAGEITFFRTLTWLRSPRLPWRQAPENILAPPAGKPILAVATGTGFLPLAEEADRELVLGTVILGSRLRGSASPGEFQALAGPGNVKAVINFLVEPVGGPGETPASGRSRSPAAAAEWSRLSTETRVFATDPASRLRFAAYWRIILPGSALIRVEWLRAICRRAEG
jgi:hypothetical protein